MYHKGIYTFSIVNHRRSTQNTEYYEYFVLFRVRTLYFFLEIAV